MVILPHRQADGNLFLGVPVCRSGARTGVDVFFRRGPLSSGAGSAAVGKKIEGRKMKETESSFFCPPFSCQLSEFARLTAASATSTSCDDYGVFSSAWLGAFEF
jgi:hypothetical protein